MDAREFLEVLAQVPDLLELARQDTTTVSFLSQRRLRAAHRQEGRPFLYSMPQRHRVLCELCGQQQAAVQHELEDPQRGVKVAFSELDLHRARDHGLPPPLEVVEFLKASLYLGEDDENPCA